MDLTVDHIAVDDSPGTPVDGDEVEHFAATVEDHPPLIDLLLQGLVGPEQQLLTGLATAVEGAFYEHTAEGSVCEHAAIFPGEGDSLCDALVDDRGGVLGEPVHIGFAGPEVTALLRVVEESVDAVTILAVVLAGVDAALGGNRVGTPRRVVVDEDVDAVALCGERRCGTGTGESRTHDDHIV